jgi:L-ascorbate metabolism protein UlaG (beta-lactamase superfamily)
MNHNKRLTIGVLVFCLALMVFLPFTARGPELSPSLENLRQVSDHFDGTLFFNPGLPQPSLSSPGNPPNRGSFWYLWRWLFNNDRPEWPEKMDFAPGPPPAARVPQGTLRITPVGHSTFLIQMDGVNILTDPIWSNRCSPVSWAGPKRYKQPGIRFEDLPPIDVVLVSHNHYDHLDLPTLKRLAAKGTPQAVVPLGDLDLVRESGIPHVDEIDWWQSISMSPQVKITLVPAQHFSARTPWDRNKTLWGGFVVSGTSGNVFYAGDTGYGPHLREIARRFSPIRVALLPISPFRTQKSKDLTPRQFSIVHLGPSEAVQAHIDLKAPLSIAAHFQVFQLGWDGFDDAVNELASALKESDLKPGAFIAPTVLGQAIELTPTLAESGGPKGKVTSIARR